MKLCKNISNNFSRFNSDRNSDEKAESICLGQSGYKK